ncbi:DUF805 domain-containing protein [bacterium DOLZORAL124_38_8]|nr:MAG: DUF805 domain-containing protein [bacterium DOLZORAL124_38_8]
MKAAHAFKDFDGRACRHEFWTFTLVNWAVTIVLGIIGGIIGTTILETIFSLVVLVPGIAVGIRRMHDINKSGWFILVPFYNIYLFCLKGDEKENQYGKPVACNVKK